MPASGSGLEAGVVVGVLIGMGAAISGIVGAIKAVRHTRDLKRAERAREAEAAAREVRGHQRAKRRTAAASATIAEVHGARTTGGDVDAPVVRFRLRVSFDGGAGDYDVDVEKEAHVVDVIRLRVGTVLPVRYDPADQHDVAVDLGGSAGLWVSPEETGA